MKGVTGDGTSSFISCSFSLLFSMIKSPINMTLATIVSLAQLWRVGHDCALVYSILTFGHGHWFLEPANTGLQHSLLLSWHTTPTTEESKHQLLTAATIRHSKVPLCIAIVNMPNSNSRFHLAERLHLYDPKTAHDSFSITMSLHTSYVFELLFIKLICIRRYVEQWQVWINKVECIDCKDSTRYQSHDEELSHLLPAAVPFWI